MHRPSALVLSSPPGAGSALQAQLLAERSDRIVRVAHAAPLDRIAHRSTEHARASSDVPDGSLRALERALDSQRYGPQTLFVLDDLPRNLDQVGSIDELVEVKAVIELYASDEALIEKLRASHSYDLRTIRESLEAYRSLTEPAIDSYRLRTLPVCDIGALTGTPEQIHYAILGNLETVEGLAPWFSMQRSMRGLSSENR